MTAPIESGCVHLQEHLKSYLDENLSKLSSSAPFDTNFVSLTRQSTTGGIVSFSRTSQGLPAGAFLEPDKSISDFITDQVNDLARRLLSLSLDEDRCLSMKYEITIYHRSLVDLFPEDEMRKIASFSFTVYAAETREEDTCLVHFSKPKVTSFEIMR